ncbi:DUF7269 family protein [Halogeometricum limi]|uniref:Uncharacterized protein n=1 Tax=Halogeometricum limi TaxID=555875 RepID=A0A1I6ILV4_9EURY|nr:hypothetical protein [Halogeometricum limi]SFR67641.1 hypothetical protein SAMN04488124_3386 [Halogeometricum limi]
MNHRRSVAALAGFAAVVVAAALVFGVLSPNEVPAVSDAVETLDDGQLLLALAGTLLLGRWFARRRATSSTTERFTKLRADPPEGVSAPASIRVGGRFDRVVADAVTAEDDDAMRSVASRLRTTATDLYADAEDTDRPTARRRVAAGAWTDDRLAAAFLAADERPPFRSRLRAWLDPSRERRRRVETTVEALFELREGVVPDADSDVSTDAADGVSEGDGVDEDEADANSGDEGRGESWVGTATDGGVDR